MANYATNLFFASTENEKDLDKVEKFLEENFSDCYQTREEDYIEAKIVNRKKDEAVKLLNGLFE